MRWLRQWGPAMAWAPEVVSVPRIRRAARSTEGLFRTIVRRLARDDHVVYVAFTESGRGDAYKTAAFLQLVQITDTAVAHAATQPAHQLLHQRRQQPFVRHATFYALRDGLPAVGGLLGIAVG